MPSPLEEIYSTSLLKYVYGTRLLNRIEKSVVVNEAGLRLSIEPRYEHVMALVIFSFKPYLSCTSIHTACFTARLKFSIAKTPLRQAYKMIRSI